MLVLYCQGIVFIITNTEITSIYFIVFFVLYCNKARMVHRISLCVVTGVVIHISVILIVMTVSDSTTASDAINHDKLSHHLDYILVSMLLFYLGSYYISLKDWICKKKAFQSMFSLICCKSRNPKSKAQSYVPLVLWLIILVIIERIDILVYFLMLSWCSLFCWW